MKAMFGNYLGEYKPNNEEKAIIEKVANDIESKYSIKIPATPPFTY